MTDIRETFSKRMGEMIADIMGADAVKDMYEKGNLTDEQKQKPSGLLALDLGIVTAEAKNALLIAQAAERTLQAVERTERALDKMPALAKSILKDAETASDHNSWIGTVSRYVTGQPKPKIADKIKTYRDFDIHKKERFDKECGFLPCESKEFQHLGFSNVSEPHFTLVAIVSGDAKLPEKKKAEEIKAEDVDAVTLAQTINYLARQEEVMTKNAVFWSVNHSLEELSGKSGKEIADHHRPRYNGLKEVAGHLYHMAADMLEKEGYPDAAAKIRNDEAIQNAAGKNMLGKTRAEQFEAYAGLPANIVDSAYNELKANDDRITNYSGAGLSRGMTASDMREILKLSEIMGAMPGILKDAGCITEKESANMSANTKDALPNKSNVLSWLQDLSRPFGDDAPKQEQGKLRVIKVEV